MRIKFSGFASCILFMVDKIYGHVLSTTLQIFIAFSSSVEDLDGFGE